MWPDSMLVLKQIAQAKLVLFAWSPRENSDKSATIQVCTEAKRSIMRATT